MSLYLNRASQMSGHVGNRIMCTITFEITFISKVLDSRSKYHILESTRPRSSVGRALGLHIKGLRFDSHRGQANF